MDVNLFSLDDLFDRTIRWDDLPQASGADGEDPAAARDRIIHAIGNLTLVSKRLNPALSNAPWADKRAALRGLAAGGTGLIRARVSRRGRGIPA